MMTNSACQFIGPLTFEGLTGSPLTSILFPLRWPTGPVNGQMCCVAPLMQTPANQWACDDMLTTTLLHSTRCSTYSCTRNEYQHVEPSHDSSQSGQVSGLTKCHNR